MIGILTRARFASRLAPFLILALVGFLAAGCGESQQVDPNIKTEIGKTFQESLPKSNLAKGKKAQDVPSTKSRLGGGRE